MIEVRNISKAFGNQQVIKDISATFHSGKTNLVLGISGSGKTVLMKCMVGLLTADEGEVLYNGEDFYHMSSKEKKAMRQNIGMLFQGGALFDSMTVEENILLSVNMFTDWSKTEKLDRVNFVLDRVNLENVNNKYPSELSGGMQKRVGIARAIVLNPKYLFCDEPNSGLDPKTAIVIDELIQEITTEYDITTIINTHDMNSVMEIGQSIIFLHQGSKEWEGNSSSVLESTNEEMNSFIFASEFLQKARETMLRDSARNNQ